MEHHLKIKLSLAILLFTIILKLLLLDDFDLNIKFKIESDLNNKSPRVEIKK